MPPSSLSLRALALAHAAIESGIRGGAPGWGRFRGLEVDAYQGAAGYHLPEDRLKPGFPWCMAAQFSNHRDAEMPGEQSSCPRTGSTLSARDHAPPWCRLGGPRPGAVGILRHSDGIHGHAVQCEAVILADGTVLTQDNWPADDVLPGPVAQVTTVEADTNATGSSRGDAWGRHTWDPSDGTRGTLEGWFDYGLPEPLAVA